MNETVQLNVRIPENLKKELSILKINENRELEEIVKEALETYLKIHKEGNPAYSIQKWVENPNFRAYPAFMTSINNWIGYIEKCQPSELEEIRSHAWAIKNAIDKRYST